MTGFRPNKPRRYGTVHAVIARAFDQLGGLEHASELLDRPADWLYAAADPDRERRKQANLTLDQARIMCRHGAVALAEDMATQAGGLFLPPVPDTAPAAMQAALAAYATESGQAMAEIITRAADGVFDQADARAALPEIDDALRALMGLRALALAALDGGPLK